MSKLIHRLTTVPLPLRPQGKAFNAVADVAPIIMENIVFLELRIQMQYYPHALQAQHTHTWSEYYLTVADIISHYNGKHCFLELRILLHPLKGEAISQLATLLRYKCSNPSYSLVPPRYEGVSWQTICNEGVARSEAVWHGIPEYLYNLQRKRHTSGLCSPTKCVAFEAKPFFEQCPRHYVKPFCVQAPEVLYEAFLKGIPERSFKNAQPYSHGREGVARKIICNENATQVGFVPLLNVWRLKRSLFSSNARGT